MASARTLGPVHDLGLLLARLVLGAIFAAHGYQKLFVFGPAGVSESFRGMGIPAPEITGPLIGGIELVGGILLALGALTSVVGLVLAADMLVAALVAHLPMGLFIDDGGWELVGALGAGALVLAAAGAGRFSLDRLRPGRKRGARRRTAASSQATSSAAPAPSAGS
ncbi:DoxX family protein [Brachybacterium sp. AOP43-C2-M15]|uniref:DoxX family protein n=1 Tax=Brachybacterium sp. AOP43-C2-M15 TaxID=3457661 RepID=UPI004033355B